MNIHNKIKILSSTIISNFWGTLEHVNFNFTFENGKTENLTHEVYGKNDGVAILLYNSETKNVILSKQFRMPVFVAGVSNGFSVEVVGGALDDKESPKDCVLRETEEEVGYQIREVTKVSTVFLSPGLVKERVHLFIGAYTDADNTNNGGGLDDEHEEIEVLELPFEKAFNMIETEEIIDARTIMLLQHLKLKL